MHPFGISEGGTLIREKKDPEFRESNKIKAEKEAEEKKRREEEESKLLEEYGNLNTVKKIQEVKKGHKKYLFSPFMEDIDIELKMFEDMENIARQESGTGWMKLGTLLTFDTTQQILGAGFKTIIDQNKLIIRQNELLLRELKKFNEKEKE